MSGGAVGKGYVQVYTGNGKGKTTASLGLAVRAAGHGLKTVEALTDVVGPTATIAPTLDSFAEAMAADAATTQRSPK